MPEVIGLGQLRSNAYGYLERVAAGETIAFPDRWGKPVMLAGAAMAAYGLAFVAAEGFAPYGHYPWVTALIFAVGVTLVALRSTKVSRRSVDAAARTG